MCCCCKKNKGSNDSVHKAPEVVVEEVNSVKAIILEPVNVEPAKLAEIEEIEEIEIVEPLKAEPHGLGIKFIAEESSPLFKKWINTIYITEGDKAKELYNNSKDAREIEAFEVQQKLVKSKKAATALKQKLISKSSTDKTSDEENTSDNTDNKSTNPSNAGTSKTTNERNTANKNTKQQVDYKITANNAMGYLENTSEFIEKPMQLHDGHKSSVMALEKQDSVIILVSKAFEIPHPVSTVRAIQVVGDTIENVIKSGHTLETLLPIKDTITYATPQMNADYEQNLMKEFGTSRTYTSDEIIDERKKKAFKARIKRDSEITLRGFVIDQNYEMELIKDFPIGTFELNPSNTRNPTWASIVLISENTQTKQLFLDANNLSVMIENNLDDFENWCANKKFQNGLKIIDSFKELFDHENYQETSAINLEDIEKQFCVKSSVSDVFLTSFDQPMRAVKFLGYSQESVVAAQNELEKYFSKEKYIDNKTVNCLVTSCNSITESKTISDRIIKGSSKNTKQEGKTSHTMYIPFPFNYEKYFGLNTQCKIVKSVQQKTNTTITCSRKPLIHKGVLKYKIEVDGTNNEAKFSCIKYLVDSADIFKTATIEWNDSSDRKAYYDYITKVNDLSDEPTVQVIGEIPPGVSGDSKTQTVKYLIAIFAAPKLIIERGPFFNKHDSQLLRIIHRYNCVAKFTGIIGSHDGISQRILSTYATWYRIHIFGINLTLTKKCINSVVAVFPDWILIKFCQQV